MSISLIKKIFRIVLAPLVFVVTLGAISLFAGPACMIFGPISLVISLLTPDNNDKEDPKEMLLMSTLWIWYPFMSVYTWVQEGKIPD